MATRTVNFPQITAAFIVANNPEGVRQVLTDNGFTIGQITSDKDLAKFLYSIYLSKGPAEFVRLVQLVPLNKNANNWTTDINKLNELNSFFKQAGVSQITNPNAKSFFEDALDTTKSWLVGGSSSVTAPTVTTETKSSPLTVALIIGGVLLVGVMAYVVVKS